MDIECILKNLKEMLVERGEDISMFEEHELSIDKEDYENDKSVTYINWYLEIER